MFKNVPVEVKKEVQWIKHDLYVIRDPACVAERI